MKLKRNMKVLFRIGAEAGFFSEYNNMILSYYWCLLHNIDFVLSSKYSNIAYEKGWSDYFKPYFKEANFFLDTYNCRREFIPYRKKDTIKKSIFKLYCLIKGFNLTTKDIFWLAHRMNIQEKNSVEGLLPMDIVSENCRRLNNMVWNYNDKTLKEIKLYNDECEIRGDYVSAHIRKGDKIVEADDIPVDTYIMKMEQLTNIRKCFVFTDDYSVILFLKEHYPDWSFFTLCKENDKGYNHQEFVKSSKKIIRERLVYLFANIEKMAASKYFFGTMSSNIGMYMYWRMPKGRCIGIDFEDWRIW